jgi:hypothetical protein
VHSRRPRTLWQPPDVPLLVLDPVLVFVVRTILDVRSFISGFFVFLVPVWLGKVEDLVVWIIFWLRYRVFDWEGSLLSLISFFFRTLMGATHSDGNNIELAVWGIHTLRNDYPHYRAFLMHNLDLNLYISF